MVGLATKARSQWGIANWRPVLGGGVMEFGWQSRDGARGDKIATVGVVEAVAIRGALGVVLICNCWVCGVINSTR